MELYQLRYFQKIAQLEHLTRAAEALSISQPALSRSLARLEAELGAPLFDRVGRQIRLNQLGRVFLARVDRVLKEIEEGERELADLGGPERGRVALGLTRTLSAEPVPDLLHEFRARYPGVSFRIAQNSTPRVLQQLVGGDVDLCLLPVPIAHPGIGWTALVTQPLLLAVPPEHRLARAAEVALSEVAGEDFVGLATDTKLRQASDALCAEAGFTPRFAFEGEELALVFRLVATGLGVALIPAHAWDAFAEPKPVAVRLREPQAEWAVGLAWPEERYLTAAPRLFRAFVTERFRPTA